MKNMYFIILLFGLLACSKKKTDLPFILIDYSYNNGWNSVYSIKIDSMGQIYIQGEDIHNGKWFIRTEIDSSVIDSLCTLVNNIDCTSLDTLYKKNCVDCGYYYLIINKRGKIPIKVFVEDTKNNNIDLIGISKLSEYLNSLVRTIRLQIKTIKFESKTKDFYLILLPQFSDSRKNIIL